MIRPERSETTKAAPTTEPPQASTKRMLWRGFTRRCALCGSGHLFRRWFSMVPECPRCGYHFEREEGFFLGAFVINFVVAEGALILLLIVGFAITLPDPPLGKLVAVGLALSVLVPVIGYPFSKTVWSAVDHIMRKTMGESYRGGRQPGFKSRG